jgi:hypothetical protein
MPYLRVIVGMSRHIDFLKPNMSIALIALELYFNPFYITILCSLFDSYISNFTNRGLPPFLCSVSYLSFVDHDWGNY